MYQYYNPNSTRFRRDFLRGDAQDAQVPVRCTGASLLRPLPAPPPHADAQAPQHRLRPLHLTQQVCIFY